jgi:hypothetical protein
MASLFNRPDSPFVWIRYKAANGKWKAANTGFRKNTPGDRTQARLLVREQSAREARQKLVDPGKASFEEWLPSWVEQKWGQGPKETLRHRRNSTRNWLAYLRKVGITTPAGLKRGDVFDYVAHRQAQGVSRNTALTEAKFFAQVLDEAILRGFIQTNVARKLGLKRNEEKHKQTWTPEQIETALQAAESSDKFGWIHVALLLGKFQASRLNQSEVPLSAIDLERGAFHWPAELMKSRKQFDQPVDPKFLPLLAEIVAHRKKLGKSTLADLPRNPSPSLELRAFLDSIGLAGLSHHGLRATWVTRAALAGIPEAVAMRFSGHASREVHSIYQSVTAADATSFFEKLG